MTTQIGITHHDYTMAKYNLIGGTHVITAHIKGQPEGEVKRIIQVKIKGGNYFGKVLNTGRWEEIDAINL